MTIYTEESLFSLYKILAKEFPGEAEDGYVSFSGKPTRVAVSHLLVSLRLLREGSHGLSEFEEVVRTQHPVINSKLLLDIQIEELPKFLTHKNRLARAISSWRLSL